MSRSQIIALTCAFVGLALGISIANWQFTEVGVLTGARLLYGIFGFVGGYFGGTWFFVDRKARGFSSE